MNPINTAILQGNFKEAKTLLENGEAWNMQPFMEKQAYEKLIKSEAFDLLKLFIEKEHISLDVFECEKFDGTIFSLLAKVPYTENLAAFLNEILPEVENIDDELMGLTWLAYAVKNKANQEFIQKLIDNGCNLHWISTKGENLLFFTQDIEMTRFLLDEGLDINTKNIGGKTLLFDAIQNQKTELIELYLEYGADPNSQDIQGNTAYHEVLFSAVSPELFEMLANYAPVRFDQKNKQNQSLVFEFVEKAPLSWESEIKLLELLIEQGADLFQTEKDMYGEETTTARMLAKKSYDLLTMVLEKGAFDINEQDNKGNTWLHYICSEDLNFDQQKAQELYKKVKLLLKNDADPTILNDQDKTPIDYAQDDDLKAKVLTLLLKQ